MGYINLSLRSEIGVAAPLVPEAVLIIPLVDVSVLVSRLVAELIAPVIGLIALLINYPLDT
jgi:hypothetical protein